MIIILGRGTCSYEEIDYWVDIALDVKKRYVTSLGVIQRDWNMLLDY